MTACGRGERASGCSSVAKQAQSHHTSALAVRSFQFQFHCQFQLRRQSWSRGFQTAALRPRLGSQSTKPNLKRPSARLHALLLFITPASFQTTTVPSPPQRRFTFTSIPPRRTIHLIHRSTTHFQLPLQPAAIAIQPVQRLLLRRWSTPKGALLLLLLLEESDRAM